MRTNTQISFFEPGFSKLFSMTGDLTIGRHKSNLLSSNMEQTLVHCHSDEMSNSRP